MLLDNSGKVVLAAGSKSRPASFNIAGDRILDLSFLKVQPSADATKRLFNDPTVTVRTKIRAGRATSGPRSDTWVSRPDLSCERSEMLNHHI